MDTKKAFGYLIFIGLIIYTLVLGIFGDSIANLSYNLPLAVQLIIYYVTQIQFILIFIGAVYIGVLEKKVYRGIGAGFLLSIATDMISYPHCVTSTGFIENPNIALCSDTIFIKILDIILPHSFSYALYYYILPVLIFIIALELLGITKLIKELIPQA
jgi:hypothetical protein